MKKKHVTIYLLLVPALMLTLFISSAFTHVSSAYAATNTASATLQTTSPRCNGWTALNSEIVYRDSDAARAGKVIVWYNSCSGLTHSQLYCYLYEFADAGISNYNIGEQNTNSSCKPGNYVNSPNIGYQPGQTYAFGYLGSTYFELYA